MSDHSIPSASARSSASSSTPVTILLSVYNGADYIAETIDSILAQTFSDFDFLIIDNASTDQTAAILDRYSDSRIRRYRNDRQLTLTESLNKGLSLTESSCIARIDADDIARPDRLARQVDYLNEHPAVTLVGTWCEFMDHHGHPCGEPFMPPEADSLLRDALASFNPVAHPSACFRLAAARAAGGYPEAYSYAQDMGLWIRLARQGELANIPEFLTCIRIHPGQESVNPARRLVRAQDSLALFREAGSLPGLSPAARRRSRQRRATDALDLGDALCQSGSGLKGLGWILRALFLAPFTAARHEIFQTRIFGKIPGLVSVSRLLVRTFRKLSGTTGQTGDKTPGGAS